LVFDNCLGQKISFFF